MLSKMRVAIIGLGAATRNIHLPAYSRIKNRVSVVAGCDLDRKALARCGNKLAQLYDNPEEMLEKTRPDIVSICTPPSLHLSQTLLALDYGCHVFCEKPMAEDLAQADAIIDASERADRLVVINNQFPSMNIYSASKAYFNSAEFGRLLYLHAWQTFRPTQVTEAGWRSELRRRTCFEFGIHVFELIRFFFDDDPIRVLAHMPCPSANATSEPINVIAIEFSDGRAASVLLDRLSKGPECYLEMRLDGEFATIHTSIGGRLSFGLGLKTRERRLFVQLDIASGGKAVIQNGERSRVIGKEGINPFASATARRLTGLIDAIENGSTPQGLAVDNRRTLALVSAAYDSARYGKAVETSWYHRDSPARGRGRYIELYRDRLRV